MASTSTPAGTPKKLQKRKSKQYSTCLLYNTGQALAKLTDLTLAACNPTLEGQGHVAEPDNNPTEVTVQQRADYTTVSEKMSCNCCSTDFSSREEQTKHYKSDWHRYNLRLRLKDQDSITEAKFIEISACVSSISGSESESDDSDIEDEEKRKLRSKPGGIAAYLRQRVDSCSSSAESDSELTSVVDDASRRFPKLFFRNKDGELISIYRCILYHKKNQPTSLNDLATMATNAPHHMTWAIMMAAGGHFAAAIFDKNEILVHKTFHRYVVRAKRGTAQSSRDCQGNAPKSAGASLRRYNEAALKEEVQELFSSWSDLLSKCHLIFLRAPSFNKRIFFSGKTPPLQKKDERIRMIPFATRRPTHNEVRRVHEVLCSIECYGEESDIRDFVPISPAVTFSADTGHLEVVPDDPQTSPRHRKNLNKARLKTSPLANSKTSERPDCAEEKTRPTLKCQQLELIDAIRQDENQISSSGTSTASDTDLVESMETLSTDDLREFRATRKPRPHKQRARKRRPSLKRQIAPESDALEEEKYHLKNSLYTACKVGDIETLRNLLAVFTSEPVPVNNVAAPSDDNNGKNTDVISAGPVSSVNGSQGNSDAPCKLGNEHEESFNDLCKSSEVSLLETENKNASEIDSSNRAIDGKVRETLNESPKEKAKMNLDITNETCRELKGSSCDAEEIVSPMVSVAILNEPIGDQLTTLLHVAAKEGHKKVIKALLESGADPAVKDKYGKTPYISTSNKEVRNEFRRFMAVFPHKYDYETAQVPSPLTAEMEIERKQKEAERKKIQKKAKQERMKEKRLEEAEKKKEEMEKARFLSLSDREKRALAAEKRLLKQTETEGSPTPVLSRCYQCGKDMTGKVPFEYCDYKFCTTKCLKEHRLSNTKK